MLADLRDAETNDGHRASNGFADAEGFVVVHEEVGGAVGLGFVRDTAVEFKRVSAHRFEDMAKDDLRDVLGCTVEESLAVINALRLTAQDLQHLREVGEVKFDGQRVFPVEGRECPASAVHRADGALACDVKWLFYRGIYAPDRAWCIAGAFWIFGA